MHTHSGERENYVRDFVMAEQGMLRQRLETAIESMLALLDELDGDAADYEPDNDDEPWLSRREGIGSGDFHNPDEGEEQDDTEADPAESGIADVAGLWEQVPNAFHGWAI